MRMINFNALEDCIECYGRENLIPVSSLKQIIFYIKSGVQPKFIWEKEDSPGKITGWFLKAESTYVYKRWIASRPVKIDE